VSKIALVHDYFIQMGGPERVAAVMHESFPSAPLYATVALQHRLPNELRNADIRTSPMQWLPSIEHRFQQYFMLYPFAVEQFDLSEYDLILSSSSGYAKGVRRRRNAIHVCYCHTPMRWVWRYQDYVRRENFGRTTRSLLPVCMWAMRKWDLRAAQQPTYYIASSQLVADRLKKIYGREAFVIPPPIDVDRFQPSTHLDDYYLVLSRLLPYKHLDVAVEACNRLKRRLLIVGDGPDRKRLESIAGPTIEFLGRQPDQMVNRYASRCRALLFPGEEDCALVPLEVNAAGRPVIAFRAGGALETVLEGVTGLFFDQQNPASLVKAIEEFESRTWLQPILRQHAEKFDRKAFSYRMLQFLGSVAPSSCATDLLTGAQLLSRHNNSRAWPRLAVAR
jgi:glycosyltransferase involved in cell wall biosynthesis